MPKKRCAFRKSHTRGGRSRRFQVMSHSSSMAHSCATGPSMNACSCGVSVATGTSSSLRQSGLPVNRSASHQESPASMASRSVADMGGKALRAQRYAGSEMRRRRQALKSMSVPHCYGPRACRCKVPELTARGQARKG
ncbi:hypothetical protein D3C87_1671410 [compost metagenome]